MTDEQFIGACPALRRELRHTQIDGDQPAEHCQALRAAHQLQAGPPTSHRHILEKSDGVKRVQKITRHHKIHGPTVGKPQQHQNKPQQSP